MNDYPLSQQQRNKQYRDAYAEWVATLSPEELRQLQAEGVDVPDVPRYQTRKTDDGMCLELYCEDEGAAVPGEPEENSPEEMYPKNNYDTDALLTVLRRLLGELLARDNVRLTVDCISLVTGISYDGASMTAIAKRHKVTRAAVSKRCVLICEALGLPPSRAMQQLTTRRVHEHRARNYHSRKSAY